MAFPAIDDSREAGQPRASDSFHGLQESCRWVAEDPSVRWEQSAHLAQIWNEPISPKGSVLLGEGWLFSVYGKTGEGQEGNIYAIYERIIEDFDFLYDKENEDGERGAYREAFAIAKKIILEFSKISYRIFGRELEKPAINAVDDNEVDIYWGFSSGKTLLINVPPEADGAPAFYGKDKMGGTIEGYVPEPSNRCDLVSWLVC